jgi:hypothetical protein
MKRTEIIIETERLLMRNSRPSIAAWCPVCDVHVSMLTPSEFAQMQILNTTTRDIYRRLESGELHGIETPEGNVFICARSLPDADV